MNYQNNFDSETTGVLPTGWTDTNAFYNVLASVGYGGGKGFGNAAAIDDRRTTYSVLADLDCCIQYDVQINIVAPGGGGAFVFPYLRSDSAAGNAYTMGLIPAAGLTANSGLYRFWKRQSGSFNLVTGGQFTGGPTWAVGTWITVKFEVQGTASPVLRIKVWEKGTVEPGSWTFTVTDTSNAFTTAGRAGLGVGAMGGTVSGLAVVDNLFIGPAGSTFTPVGEVLPLTSTIDVGGTQQLTAGGFTGGSVVWSSLNPTIASVDSTGLVTGLAHHQSSSQTATIRATGVSNPSEVGSVTVTVRAVSVVVAPSTAIVNVNGTQQFTATVTGAADTGKTWSVITGGGTINSSGLYTAPAIPESGVVVRAASVADTQRTGTATLIIDALTVWITTMPFGATYSGLSTVGVTLLNDDNTTYQVRTTTGVHEAGAGAYFLKTLVQTNWYGVAKWDTGTSVPEVGLEARNPSSLITPVETPGRPTEIEGMIRRLFEYYFPPSMRTRNRSTGEVVLYAEDGETVLDSVTQITTVAGSVTEDTIQRAED